MDRYEKCVHRDVANAKPYRFWDSVFFSAPQSNVDVSVKSQYKSPEMHKIWDKSLQFLQISGFQYFKFSLELCVSTSEN